MNLRTRSVGWTVALLAASAALGVSLAATAAQNQAEPQAGPAKTAGTVVSKDGTSIAYEQCGQGPVLILVAPALSDHHDAARLATLLAPSFTVVNYDRRGRGASGDQQPFAVEREIEDLDALIARSGGKAALFGSSSGAVLALEAANKLAERVSSLVVFEPPFIVDDSRPPIAAGFFEEIGALVDAGRRGDAVALFMTRGIGVPDEMVEQMRHAPMWSGLERRAHTLRYDGALMAGLQTGQPLPKDRWTAITARTLVLEGEFSPAFLRHAAGALAQVLPQARRQTLADQDHSAVFTAPESLVPVLVDFLARVPLAPR